MYGFIIVGRINSLRNNALDLNNHHVDFDWLKGRSCTKVQAPDEWTTVFEFGDAALSVQTLWRVSLQGQLRLTSADHGQVYGLASPINATTAAHELLVGREISAVHADLARGDLLIHLGLDCLLEIITDSHYEPWQLTGPGRNYVAAADGRIRDLRA